MTQPANCAVCNQLLDPNQPSALQQGRHICQSCLRQSRPPIIAYNTPPAEQPLVALIPYKNMPALVSYYTGLFSFFPLLGVVLAIVALIAGVKGVKKANEFPAAKGKIHAIVGIVTGVIGLIINLGCVGSISYGLLMRHL